MIRAIRAIRGSTDESRIKAAIAEDAFADMVLNVVQGKIKKAQIAEFLRTASEG